MCSFPLSTARSTPSSTPRAFENPGAGDDFDDIRSEYSGVLQDQPCEREQRPDEAEIYDLYHRGRQPENGPRQTAPDRNRPFGLFQEHGASAWGLDAKERLEVMHSIFHLTGNRSQFDGSGLPVGAFHQDFIAPSSFRFGNARMFGLGGKYGAVSF